MEHTAPEVAAAVSLLRAAKHMEATFAALFAEHGIGAHQYNVLRILYVREGEHGVPCQEISRRLVHRVPDVTRLLDRLLREGYIERARCPKDRRVVRSRLTEKGQALVERLHEPMLKLHAQVMSHLSSRDIQDLNRLLLKLHPPPDSGARPADPTNPRLSQEEPQ